MNTVLNSADSDREASTSTPSVYPKITHRERELGAIINSYNEVTERLKQSHDRLRDEVVRLHDQLDEKNRELARRERLAALGEMAAGVAHEIRNPLGGIRLYASLLIKDLDALPSSQKLARKISDGVGVLESIVGGVVEFAGESQPDVSNVRVHALVEEALGLAAPAVSSSGCDLHLVPIATELCLRVDTNQALRALLNLLLNAVDAAGEDGAIRVEATANDSQTHCEIRVSDDGAGIRADMIDRIFHPFVTTKSTGTGLGLAIVHRIADAHGGSIRAKNRKGGGAEFCLSLPLANQTESVSKKTKDGMVGE